MKHVVVCLLMLCAPLIRSAEEILDYRLWIDLQPDTTLEIREEITVRAEGNEIKRGIFRDFPVRYTTNRGMSHRVGFKVVEVLRDGEPEPWRVESKGSDQRVYVGDKDVLLRTGEYTYTLRYRTSRQLGFFEDHDELYYNAIAHGWSFPIRQATVVVRFPENFADAEFELDVWTGAKGSTTADAVIERIGPLEVKAELTKALAPNEGMTIYVEWPKGLMEPLTWTEEWKLLLEDEVLHDPFVRITLGGFFAALVAYFVFWFLYGRNPEKGVIIPRFAAPDGVSPAGARYLMRMGFDPACFAVSLLSLAAKNWLIISCPNKRTYDLETAEGEGAPLDEGEEGVFTTLLGSGTRFEIKQANHQKMQKARSKLHKALKKQFKGSHFHRNGKCLIPGIAIGLATLGLFALEAGREDVWFLMLWLTLWTFGVVALLSQVVKAWKLVIYGGGILKLGSALFISLFAVPFIAAEVFVCWLLASHTSMIGTVLLVLQAPLALLFVRLMKAPTIEGRKVMDELEGLELYLSTAEVDRLHGMHPPELTPEFFDAMLPYALAVGVEQKWAEAFESKLAAIRDPRAGSYHPHYYRGYAFTSVAAMTGALGSGLVSNVSSASTAPGSSSGGGGGGSSGGGGGGGGGGGW